MLITFLVIWLNLSLCMADWRPFQQWFPYYNMHYRAEWGNNCDALLNVSKSAGSWCENACNCILAHTPELQKANMAGAGLLLGLAPVAISGIAPNMDMLAILGRQRPFLGLLISAGSGGIYVDRPFTAVNPTICLLTDSSPIFVGTFDRRVSVAVISFLEYGIAFAAVANIIHTSYSISQRSIITWSCPNWGWVISWSILPVAVYLIAQLTFTFTVKTERPKKHSSTRPESLWRWTGGVLWEREFKPCSNRILPQYSPREGRWCYLAQTISPILAYCHLFFGIAIFGSILYVPFGDALPICCRYIASAGVCRLLLTFEFDTLKARNSLARERKIITVLTEVVQKSEASCGGGSTTEFEG
jgi:hypothetical protein